MARTPPEIKQAAQTLLDWCEKLEDPRAIAIPQAQAFEAAVKATGMGAGPETAQRAFTLRFLESVARDNAGLIDMLTEKGGNGGHS